MRKKIIGLGNEHFKRTKVIIHNFLSIIFNFKQMIKCARVLVILTEDFLEDPSSIEKYNIALCCSRNMERNFLAPLYVADIEKLPTYMGLIQYIDAR